MKIRRTISASSSYLVVTERCMSVAWGAQGNVDSSERWTIRAKSLDMGGEDEKKKLEEFEPPDEVDEEGARRQGWEVDVSDQCRSCVTHATIRTGISCGSTRLVSSLAVRFSRIVFITFWLKAASRIRDSGGLRIEMCPSCCIPPFSKGNRQGALFNWQALDV